MRIPRIFVDIPLAVGEQTELTSEVSHYLTRVLRLLPGAEIVLFNGIGGEYHAHIIEANKRSSTVQIDTFVDRNTSSPILTHLGIGISRGERMDWVIQKATELGVSEITPLFSERSEVKLSGDRLSKRLSHWQKVSISACEQSGRTHLPKIHLPISVDTWANECRTEKRWILHPGEKASTKTAAKPSSISLLIGSEGGLTEIEIENAIMAGFDPISLGPRILRTETAPISALSIIQFLWGDLG